MRKSYIILLALMLGLFMVTGCEDDTATGPEDEEAAIWVGNWLSTGDNVAVILSAYFNYDSVKVEMTADNTVTLETHTTDGAWTTSEGTYVITESTEGDIHAVELIYTAFSQEGIIEIIGDTMRLEAVQTVPDIAATVPTVAGGFGADPTLGTINIQTYIRQD